MKETPYGTLWLAFSRRLHGEAITLYVCLFPSEGRAVIRAGENRTCLVRNGQGSEPESQRPMVGTVSLGTLLGGVSAGRFPLVDVTHSLPMSAALWPNTTTFGRTWPNLAQFRPTAAKMWPNRTWPKQARTWPKIGFGPNVRKFCKFAQR